jgi:hypothetical protein
MEDPFCCGFDGHNRKTALEARRWRDEPDQRRGAWDTPGMVTFLPSAARAMASPRATLASWRASWAALTASDACEDVRGIVGRDDLVQAREALFVSHYALLVALLKPGDLGRRAFGRRGLGRQAKRRQRRAENQEGSQGHMGIPFLK